MKRPIGMNGLFEPKVFPRFHAVVLRAVRERVLVPKPCEVCGAEGIERLSNGVVRRAIVAHHDDYNKPLNVTWLCRIHHWGWHKLHESLKPSEAVAAMTNGVLYEYGLKVLRGEIEPHPPEPVAVILDREAERRGIVLTGTST